MNQNDAVAWIADLLEEAVQELRPDTPLDAIGAWDSLGVLTLMAALGEQFDITVETDEMLGLTTVEDILAILRHHEKLIDGETT